MWQEFMLPLQLKSLYLNGCTQQLFNFNFFMFTAAKIPYPPIFIFSSFLYMPLDFINLLEPSACRSALVLHPCRHGQFVFPFIVPCVRLPSVDWLLWGKWKARALPRGFLLGFDFRVRVSYSWFHLINYWVLSLAGPGAGGSISSYFLRECYADFRDMFWGKVLFRSLYFQIEVSVMFCDDPRRLPSVCLGRGWYEFTSP